MSNNYPVLNHLLADAFKPQECELYATLVKLFNVAKAQDVFMKYAIGTAKDKKPIFWQLTPEWNIQNAKCNSLIVYDKTQYEPGLFGAHLLNEAGNKSVIYLLETEMDCVLMYCMFPQIKGLQCLYMAPQTVNSLNVIAQYANSVSFLLPLPRVVVAFAAGAEFTNKAEELKNAGFKVTQSHTTISQEQLMKIATSTEINEIDSQIPDFSMYIANKRNLRRFDNVLLRIRGLYDDAIIMRLAKAVAATGINLTEEFTP